MASKLARMRIIAIPLTSDASIATYYHFQMPQPLNTIAKPSLLKRVTEKTASIWTAFGKAPEGSWKVRATHHSSFSAHPTPSLASDFHIWRTPYG